MLYIISAFYYSSKDNSKRNTTLKAKGSPYEKARVEGRAILSKYKTIETLRINNGLLMRFLMFLVSICRNSGRIESVEDFVADVWLGLTKDSFVIYAGDFN